MRQGSNLGRYAVACVRSVACFALLALSASLSAGDPGASLPDAACGFLYVASNGAFGFRIDGSGALLPVPGSPIAVPGPPDVAATASRPFVYFVTYAEGIRGFAIDPTSGSLSDVSGSPFSDPFGPFGFTLAADPAGRFLYVGHNPSGELSIYAIGSDGSLTLQGSPLPIPPPTRGSVVVDPQGRFVFVAGGSEILVYAIDPGTGALDPVPGSPFPTPFAGVLAVTPSGRFLLATGGFDVSVYSILADGTLQLVQVVPEGGGPYAVAVAPSGRFVYVMSPSSGGLMAYRMDGETGMLTTVPGSPFSPGGMTPTVVVVDPSGRFVYVANQGMPPFFPGSVSALAIDSSTGALTPIAGSPFPAGDLPFALATWPATVPNVPPVVSGLSVDRPVLWPPNHEMVDVTVSYRVSSCRAVVNTLSVTSNEPVNGMDDGNTAPDWVMVDDHHVKLRAERAGGGSGRVYTITVTSTDDVGRSSRESVAVSVPHDLR